MKKILFGLSLAMMFSFSGQADATTSVTIQYPNDNELRLESNEYIFYNGSLMVSPMKTVDILPFMVATKGIRFSSDKKVIFSALGEGDVVMDRWFIKMGEKQFVDGGKVYKIPQAAVLQKGRVYLPVKAVAEAYGYNVVYTKNNGNVEVFIRK